MLPSPPASTPVTWLALSPLIRARYAPLVAWLNAGDAPIYIGFGSMVFDGPKTARLIVGAARASGQRVLMQACTAGGALELSAGEVLPENIFIVGRVPHAWLLPKMAAVIHHGGAGTVGAGLRLGLPTLCCPFFGDQHFYAQACAAVGAGPPPIDFDRLSVPRLASAMSELTDARYRRKAAELAQSINAEDGLETGFSHFHSCLPLPDMVCDVATLLGERALGRVYYPVLRLKVSDEVHATLRTSRAVEPRLLEGARPHKTKTWQVQNVRDPCTGTLKGIFAFVWEALDGVVSLVVLPVQAACHRGACGLLLGVVASCFLLLCRALYAPIILFDRIATGCLNFVQEPCWSCRRGRAPSPSARLRTHPIEHILDPEPALNRIAHAARGEPLCGPRRGTFDAAHAAGLGRPPLHGPMAASEGARRAQIEEAFQRVVALRNAFDALDAASEDDALSASEVDGLDEGGLVFAGASALVGLASSMRRYMHKHGKSHLAFAELVLLCRGQIASRS